MVKLKEQQYQRGSEPLTAIEKPVSQQYIVTKWIRSLNALSHRIRYPKPPFLQKFIRPESWKSAFTVLLSSCRSRNSALDLTVFFKCFSLTVNALTMRAFCYWQEVSYLQQMYIYVWLPWAELSTLTTSVHHQLQPYIGKAGT